MIRFPYSERKIEFFPTFMRENRDGIGQLGLRSIGVNPECCVGRLWRGKSGPIFRDWRGFRSRAEQSIGCCLVAHVNIFRICMIDMGPRRAQGGEGKREHDQPVARSCCLSVCLSLPVSLNLYLSLSLLLPLSLPLSPPLSCSTPADRPNKQPNGRTYSETTNLSPLVSAIRTVHDKMTMVQGQTRLLSMASTTMERSGILQDNVPNNGTKCKELLSPILPFMELHCLLYACVSMCFHVFVCVCV